jgi:mannosyltransferase OCH1-like enzyme
MNGGIYLDIKFKPNDNFSFESMIDREHYLFDWKGSQPKYGISVANGFLISYPGNPALKSCIYEIYRNVLNKFYGAKALAPTGPWLLGKYITKNQCTTVNNFDKISYNDTIIFNMYDSYRHETESHKTHYSVFWDKNDIYKDLNMLEYTLINTTKLPDVEINTVPKQIFQTWKTLDIPSDMEQNISENIQYLPEYTFYLYSDDSCREFLSEYFHPSVLRSFDTLIPGAFRADLWRYCVLYIYGGIYMDIKYKFMRECDMDTLVKSEYFVKDRPVHFRNNNGVYNGFMIVKPRNKYLFNCIATIVENVQTKYYGYNALYPTGPGLMSEIIPTNFDYKLFYDKIENDTTDSIIMNNIPLLKSYNGYRIEQKVVTPVSYDVLWHERAIYNT